MDLKHAPLLHRLAQAAGTYQGRGINHLGEAFTGELTLKAGLDAQLIELTFRATDGDQAFHEESTWITEDLISGGIGLWTVSSNTPGVLPHKLIEDQTDGSYATKTLFRLGNPEDKSRFRQEITLCVRHDGSLEYAYAWGVPHEALASRSKCLLHSTSISPTQAASPSPISN